MLQHLCATLEDIADSLPQHFDPDIVAPVIEILRKDLAWHFRNLETALYPLLERRGAHVTELPDLIERLRQDHSADSLLALDVADSLEILVQRDGYPNPEALGFMLRCFFVGLRRNAFWEAHFILPWASKLLLPEDRDSMGAILALNKRPE